MGRVIAVCNQKGGVGKTTTAVNLAASLAAGARRTLLVDLDPQGNATSGLASVADTASPPSLYEVLAGSAPASAARRITQIPNLDLLPSSADLAGAEIEMVAEEHRESLLRSALASLRAEYEVVVVDCPPSLGLLSLNALVAADGVLVPLQCEYYALEGLSRLVGTVEKVRAAYNPGLEIEGIVLTMFDARNNIAHQVAEEVRAHFDDQVYKTVVPRNVRLSESPSFGQPILLYDADSRGAHSYLALARELLARAEARRLVAAG